MKEVKIKWISTFEGLKDIYTKKWINIGNEKIASYKFIDLMDLFINNIHGFGRATIQLNSRWLKAVYGNKYNLIMDYLLDNNIIYLYKNYATGKRCKVYKFTDEMHEANYISSKIEIPNILEKRKQAIKGEKESTFVSEYNEDVITHLKKSLKLVKLDYKLAKEYINENILEENAKLINTNIIEKINNSDIYSGFDKYGRFHTNFTVLKKGIRENFLSINGNKLAELDVKNSQPFFMSIIMKQKGFFNEEYHNDVIEGRLYEKIMICSGKPRKQVKQDVFRILYGRNRKNGMNKIEECFKEIYPEVYDWIIKYKADNQNYKILAQELQRTESKFIFNKVIPKILKWKEIPVITIHDSILFEEQHLEGINAIWQSSLKTVIKN